MVPKFPKIFGIEYLNKHAPHILDSDVVFVISEKIDGSNWRILLTDDGWECGSRNVWKKDNVSKGMFSLAIEQTEKLWERWKSSNLPPMWVYVEFLGKLKHNVIKYGRVPKNNFYLFAAKDLNANKWLDIDELRRVAKLLDIEPINVLGSIGSIDTKLLDKIISFGSVLGGKMEGVVLVTYDYTMKDIHSIKEWHEFPLMIKYVSSEFKEVHSTWCKGKPIKEGDINTINDLVNSLLDKYVTVQRLNKVVNEMKELDIYTGTPKDIGNIIRLYWEDLESEEYDAIVDDILKIVMKQFRRKLARRVSSMARDIVR